MVRRHRLALALLAIGVAALHGLLAERLSEHLAELLPELQRPPIERLQAAFVRELQPTEPPPPAAAAAPPPAPEARRAAPPPRPASAPEPEKVPEAQALLEPAATEAPPSEPAPAELPANEPARVASSAASADLAASVPSTSSASSTASAPASTSALAQSAASAPGAAPFEWPLSTRLSYTLSGQVRGEVSGSARVEWLREGERYQVRVEVTVGPAFAPMMQRRMTSDGRITERGLAPRRYDEETQIAFAAPRRAGLVFDGEAVTLANGSRQEALPGLQDTASQFVQLTWLFATGAEPLRPGGEVVVPLALPRRLDRWVYDVVGQESLATPFGALPTWHLKPRREGTPSVLSIETWFAPSLQYLPVRIVIRQGPDSYIDLMIERLPQQAAAADKG